MGTKHIVGNVPCISVLKCDVGCCVQWLIECNADHEVSVAAVTYIYIPCVCLCRIQHLPFALSALRNLKALWISATQVCMLTYLSD